MTHVEPLIPVLVGPTAGGKTALAIACAQALAEATGRPAEIISADSVQIFKGLDIGSAKPSPDQMRGIPHHLMDIIEPEESFTVHDWLTRADTLIDAMKADSICPVVVGGTHLYIKALIDGLFKGPEPEPALRERLSQRPLDDLRRELLTVDPVAAQRIHPADRRRTVRAIEVFLQTGIPISELQKQWDGENPRRSDLLLIGLEWPSADVNIRINQRVRDMMSQGLLDEVRMLLPRLGPQARQAIGYAQLAAHLRGETSLEDAVEQIKIETRRFAKNQRTWLRRLSTGSRFRWVPGTDAGLQETAQSIALQCLTP